MPRTAILAGFEAELAIQLPRLRRALGEQRRFRVDQLAELVAEGSSTARGVASDYVEDLDASADSARIEVATVIIAGARRALDDIDAALARIHSGEYGRCLRCGGSVGLQRLIALPAAGFCMGCQRHVEVRSPVARDPW